MHATWLLYRREMRAALRERTIVVNSLIIPLVLYPVTMWAMFTGIVFVRGQASKQASRVMLLNLPPSHEAFAESLEARNVRLVAPTDSLKAACLIGEGRLDAVVTFVPVTDPRTPEAFSVSLLGDGSRESSAEALGRIRDAVDHYLNERLRALALASGIDPSRWRQFEVRLANDATEKEMGSFVMGLILPLFFLIMTAVGCFYPSVDATAGERERSTWETTMSLAVSRVAIVTAKYLMVATFGTVAGLLNIGAMTLTMGTVVRPLFERQGEGIHFSLPLGALPLVVCGALLLSGFIAAVMMLFASFARTFKEGQAMITPFYMLLMVPTIVLQQQGLSLSYGLAAIPVVNVVIMIREAIAGVFHWPQIALTLGVSAVAVAASLRLGAEVLTFEDVVVGSYEGSLTTLIRQRLLGRAGKGATT